MSESNQNTAIVAVLTSNNIVKESFERFKERLKDKLQSLNLNDRTPVFGISSEDYISVHNIYQNGKKLNMVVIQSDDMSEEEVEVIEGSLKHNLPDFPISVINIGQSDSLQFFQVNKGE